MIKIIPIEIIDYIYLFVYRKNKISNIKNRLIIYNYKNAEIMRITYLISAMRIKLWYKIISKARHLKKYILSRLELLFNKKYYYQSDINNFYLEDNLNIINNCIYYSPHIPYGLCRYCSTKKSNHIFSERLILYYINNY